MRIKLFEDSRTSLISKSKASDNYVPANQYRGKNRFKRRLHSRVASSVRNFNRINMDKFFRDDILDVDVEVTGETNSYTVRMSFTGILDEIHLLLRTAEKLELKIVIKALTRAFNSNNVYVHCNCPDWKYRQAYWATMNGYNSGEPENRPSNITNPNDTKGAGCKHVNLCLSDSSWLIKVASVIFNYYNYMQEHRESLFQKYIYPAIYQQEYDQDVQLDMFDNGDLDSNEDEITKSNEYARTKGQFKAGNKYRYQKNTEPDDDQMVMDLDLNDEEDEI